MTMSRFMCMWLKAEQKPVSKHMLLDNKGLKPAELKLAESLVEENKELIVSRWKEYFKQTKQ